MTVPPIMGLVCGFLKGKDNKENNKALIYMSRICKAWRADSILKRERELAVGEIKRMFLVAKASDEMAIEKRMNAYMKKMLKEKSIK